MRARSRKVPAGDDGLSLSTTLSRGLDQARRTRAARREAANRANGRSREATEAIVDEAWSRNGLEAPTGMERDAEVSRIRNPPTAIEQTVTTARFFKDLVGAPSRFRAHLRGATSDSTGNDEGERAYEIATAREHIEIPIDEGTRARLGSIVDEGFLAPSLAKVFTIEIRGGGPGTVDVWYRPTINGRSDRLASLSPMDSERFLRPLAAATRVGQRCTSKAAFIGNRDGHRSLGIKLPLDPNSEAGRSE